MSAHLPRPFSFHGAFFDQSGSEVLLEFGVTATGIPSDRITKVTL